MLDFGISKLVEEAAKENLELTKTTAVMGSALYMSLEQMRSTKTVDHRTDIYALGVSLYELLSGTHPFTADSFSELCVKVSLDPPAPLRDHRPDVPEALAEVIAIAYARSAPERYQTAGSFAAALAPFAEPRDAASASRPSAASSGRSYPDGKIPERQPTPARRSAPPTRERPPRLAWLPYALAAGVGLGIAGVLWMVLPPKDGPHGGVPSTLRSADPPGLDAAAADAGRPSGAVVPVSVDPRSAGAPTAVDAGVRTVDAGKAGRPPPRPCRTGEIVVLPNGLKKPCGL